MLIELCLSTGQRLCTVQLIHKQLLQNPFSWGSRLLRTFFRSHSDGEHLGTPYKNDLWKYWSAKGVKAAILHAWDYIPFGTLQNHEWWSLICKRPTDWFSLNVLYLVDKVIFLGGPILSRRSMHNLDVKFNTSTKIDTFQITLGTYKASLRLLKSTCSSSRSKCHLPD